MIRVVFGQYERSGKDIDMNWIQEQIEGRRKNGVPVCMQVYIKTPTVDVVLSSIDCPSAPGGSRKPNLEEVRIFELWRRNHLNEPSFAGGNLMAFLRQISS